MSLLVLGVNHATADLEFLERCAVPPDDHAKALASLLDLEHVLEAVILSTCHRLEIYAHVTRFHDGYDELQAWLADRAGLSREDLDTAMYVAYDERSAAHLFSVTAGLDSLVVGEQQIATQVRQALELAQDADAARRLLQRLFGHAVRVGRRVRRETDISKGASSLVDVGLEVAARDVPGGWLTGRTALIVGAGEIGGLTADRLVADGAGRVLVWNRSPDKARRLARRAEGEVVLDLTEAIAAADVVVCTTGASSPVVDLDTVRMAVAGRPEDRPLVLLDLSVPRNIDPACAELPRARLIDLRSVRERVDRTVAANVMDDARSIIEDEARAFEAWINAIGVDPTIRALRDRAESVRLAELDRLSGRLAGLDDRQRETVEALSRGIVNTLLHVPTVKLKELADHAGAEHHANALRELFELDEEP